MKKEKKYPLTSRLFGLLRKGPQAAQIMTDSTRQLIQLLKQPEGSSMNQPLKYRKVDHD